MGPSSFHGRAEERARSLVGKTIDERYQIDRILAMGGMGTVYLARHLKLKKRVALKVLHPDAEDHPELFLRFEREALAGAQVNHPHVAAATDFGELPDGTRYLVMEYVRGTTLRSLIDQEAPLPPARAARIARQIALALTEIHKRGIVHRDLKPRNIMLADGDAVKIVDFGLAKIDGARVSTMPKDEEDENSRLTAGGMIFGTIEYLAPEAALGMELVDLRADLYALGVLLYEMLSGKHPFDAPNELELFAMQRLKPAPPFKERAPDVAVPAVLEFIVQKLLEKDVDARFQTGTDVVSAIDAAVPEARVPAEGQPPPSDLVSSRPPAKPSVAPVTIITSTEEANVSVKEESRPASSRRATELTSDRPPSTQRSGDKQPDERPADRREERPDEPSARPVEKVDPSLMVWSPTKREPNRAVYYIVGIGAALAFAIFAWSRSQSGGSAPAGDSTSPSVAAPVETAIATATGSAAPTIATSAAEPSASAVDSAAVTTASASAVSTASDAPPDPAAIDALNKLVKDKKLDDAAERAKGLLEAHSRLFSDKAAKSAIRKVLTTLVQKEHPRTHEIYLAVATTQGQAGPDLLYQMLESSGTSPSATEAKKTLGEEAALEKASPALRVAFKLRFAQCDEKAELLDKAAEEGDERSIVVLDIQARGCFKDTRKVDGALERLRKRLDAAKKK
ncbi:MAG: protein kinase [Polyangiaceae bacterium]|nr:protein kinase [Polyangiaceae bacterium]